MVAAVVAFASPASAQDSEKTDAAKRPVRDRVQPDQPRRPATGGLLRALDQNGDGELDQAEIDLAVASLRKLDRNRDGRITRDELGAPPVAEGSSPRPDQPDPARQLLELTRLDTDGDGKISKEEAPERMRERFDRMDRNSDGFIDQEEQQAVLRFLRQRLQEGGAGQGVRPERGAGEGGSEKPKRPAADES